MKPLIYLHYRMLANGIKYTLRTPRRLVPAIIVFLWVGQALAVALLMSRDALFLSRFGIPPSRVDQLWSACFLGLTATVSMLTYNALRDGLLIFLPPHIDFLFPSPVSRRSVLVMKLLGDYVKYALYAAFFTIIGLQGYVLLGLRVSSAFGAWLGVLLLLVFVTNLTHVMNIAAAYGAGPMKTAARLIKFTLLMVCVVLVASGAAQYVLTGDAAAGLSAAARNMLAQVLLAPIAWATDLVIGDASPGVWVLPKEVLWLSLLALASLVLVLRRQENFYEPALKGSARMARIRAAARTGDMSAVRLERHRDDTGRKSAGLWIPPFGHGAVSIVWKYVIVQYRRMGWSLLGLFLLPVVGSFVAKMLVTDKEWLRQSPLVMAYVVWAFIIAAQQDLRSELRQADVVKAMPIKGIKVIAAQTFGQWVQVLIFIVAAGISIRLMIPQAEERTLVITMSAAGSLALSCIASGAIAVLMYADSKDRLQLLIPGFVAMIFIGLTVLPSVIALVVMLALHLNLAAIAVTLLCLNVVLAWLSLMIAGNMYDKLDAVGA